MANRERVIETVELTKVFKDFWRRDKVRALDRLNLEVYKGEVFGMLGPNGSGKSTAIKIMLGLLFPTSGTVAVLGRHPRNIRVKERIGYLPEESYLYRYLNAEETLDFYGRLFNISPAERRYRIDALLEMVGLEQQRHRPLSEYSKGMARRIGLAQALINDPDLLFLDEPTTGLDPLGTRQIKDLILQLKARGKTILLCSHLLADVEDVCDRIGILYGGKMWRQGPVRDLLAKKKQTQITVEELSPATLEKIRALIAAEEGVKPTRIDTPMERLEEYFLGVVDEARAARMTTAGATEGTGVAAFLAAQEGEKKDLLAELTEAAKETVPAPETPLEPQPLPASPRPPEPDRGLLERLTAAVKEPEPPSSAEEPEPQPATPRGEDASLRAAKLLQELLAAAQEKSEAEKDEDRSAGNEK